MYRRYVVLYIIVTQRAELVLYIHVPAPHRLRKNQKRKHTHSKKSAVFSHSNLTIFTFKCSSQDCHRPFFFAGFCGVITKRILARRTGGMTSLRGPTAPLIIWVLIHLLYFLIAKGRYDFWNKTLKALEIEPVYMWEPNPTEPATILVLLGGFFDNKEYEK
jgi:hypothetical protein